MVLSENATKFREQIIDEITRLGSDVTRWRTREEWQTLSGLGDMTYASVANAMKRYDKTLELEIDNNTRPPKIRWKLSGGKE